MIAHIRGVVEELSEEAVVLDVNGVGYEVFVPKRALGSIPLPGGSVRLFTHDHHRDTDHDLFGFLTRGERDLFETLLEVSGVGPRSALSLLSLMEPAQTIAAVQHGDIASLAKAQGIGRKTAQRIVLDLQNKVGALVPISLGTVPRTGSQGQAVEALIALGASEPQAEEAARRARQGLDEDASTEDIVRVALRSLTVSG